MQLHFNAISQLSERIVWIRGHFSSVPPTDLKKQDWIGLSIVLRPDFMHPAKYEFRHSGRPTSSEKLKQSTTDFIFCL